MKLVECYVAMMKSSVCLLQLKEIYEKGRPNDLHG